MSRAQHTRERMLEVAEMRFARLGYEGAHLESIAREVGVRKTALYHYFESKEALYVAVLERMLREFEDVVRGALEPERPPLEQSAELLQAVNQLFAERRTYPEIAIRVFVDRIPVDATKLRPIIERLVSLVLRFYQRGVQEGVFRAISSRHLFSSALGMLVFHYAGGDFSAGLIGVDDVFEEKAVRWRFREMRRLLLHGVLKHPPREGDEEE